MENRAKFDVILADFRRILTDPTGFYRQMPHSGGFADPLIFILIMAFAAGLLMAIVSLFGVGFIGALTAGFAAIITLPIAALISSFIGAAIMFVIWKLMGSSRSYETAYRCICYASAIYPIVVLVGLIPYLGAIVGVAGGIYLLIIASVEVHELPRKSVLIVLGILGGVMLLFNLSSEYAARTLAHKAEKFGQQMEGIGEQFKDFENMTPEEAGKAMGEFFKGINDVAKEMEASSGQGAAANVEESTGTGQRAANEEMTPEEAGRALGEFFKGLQEATQDLPQADSASDSSSVSAAEAAAAEGNAAGN